MMKTYKLKLTFLRLLIIVIPIFGFLKGFVFDNYVKKSGIIVLNPTYISEKECSSVFCSKRYNFNLTNISVNNENFAIGYHSTFVDSSIEINGKKRKQVSTPDDILMSWYEFKRYNIESKHKNVSVIAYSPTDTLKIGMSETKLFAGSIESLKSTEYLFNLFNIYIYVFLGILCAFLGIVASRSSLNIKASQHTTAILVFFTMLGFSHTFDNILIGIGFSKEFVVGYIRILFITTVLTFIESYLNKKLVFLKLSVLCYFSLSLFSWEYSSLILHGTYRWVYAALTILFISTAFYKKQYNLLSLSFYFIWDTLALLNLTSINSGIYLSPLAIPSIYILLNHEGIIQVLKNHASWMKKESITREIKKFKSSPLSNENIEILLFKILESMTFEIGCTRASICYLGRDNPIVFTIKDKKKQVFDDGIMPSIFGRVMQANEEIWWATDEELNQYKKLEDNKDKYHSVSTICPIVLNGEVYGAISFSDFNNSKEELIEKTDEIKVYIESYMDLITNYLIHNKNLEITIESKLHEEISKDISDKLLLSSSIYEANETLVTTFSHRLSCIVMLFEFQENDRRLTLTHSSGMENELELEWKKVPFRARIENKTSPFAVAINEKRSIFIKNISSYFSIFKSKHSQILFEKSQTKGFYCTPLISYSKIDSLLVLLENNDTPFFGNSLSEVISTSVNYYNFKFREFSLLNTHQKTDELLGKFVPQFVKDKILQGEEAIEEDFGILLMVDLKMSTKISSISSEYADLFVDCVDELRTILTEYANNIDYVLQRVNWDAIYFTFSYRNNKKLDWEELEKFANLIRSKTNELYTKYFPKLQFSPSFQNEDCCRIVFTEGDISRSVMNKGNTSSWGIHGTTMAQVCKLEEFCKGKNGFFFTLKNVVNNYSLKGWHSTGEKFESVGEEVYTYIPKQSEAA